MRIENGLLPAVVIKGSEPRTAKLVDRMRELNIPGVSITVFQDGRIDWSRGWGLADVASKRKVDSSTRFPAASISKPVAAVAALSLVSRKRLALDDDVNTSLKTWKVPGQRVHVDGSRHPSPPADALGRHDGLRIQGICEG
jgi:CubicO group peptidase (beta-lactamase class C family)